MNSGSPLLVSDDAFVRTLTLNRPHRLNALTAEMGWLLIDALEDAARDDDVRVVVLTGAGRGFCSGFDITPGEDSQAGSRPSQQQQLLDDISWIGLLFLAVRSRCDKPVVGAINGVATGAGMALAMACDIRIAARGASLAPGYVRIGAPPDGGATMTLLQAVGREAAFRFLVEDRAVLADEALTRGLVGEVVDDDGFSQRVHRYAHELAGRPPLALRLTKRSLNEATEGTTASTLRMEIAGAVMAFRSDDASTARQARREQTEATYIGM